MSHYSSYAMPAGRILIAIIFIAAGFGKFVDPATSQGYMAGFGIPTFLLWPAAILELVGGIMLVVGFQTRITALLLAGFSVLSAIIFHSNFSNPAEMISFMKNLAIAGGLLFLIHHGPGRLSVDGE